MDLFQLYIDEDASDDDLLVAFRSRGLPFLTTEDAGLRGADDEDQLAFAAKQERVIYT